MIIRIAVLLAILAGITTGFWYFFLREGPHGKIRRWRAASEFFFQEAGDLATAEKLNARVLELLPNSIHDLYTRARILERRGSIAALEEALGVYDTVLASSDNPRLLAVSLSRSRVLRALRRFGDAQGAALSVMDSFPFESRMELGNTALALLDPATAINQFDAALRDFATGDWERARAHESRAVALSLLLALRTTPADEPADQDESSSVLREAWREQAGESVDAAINALANVARGPAARGNVLLWLASLVEKRAALKREGETPYADGVAALEELLESLRRDARTVSPTFLASLGVLTLKAAWFELEAARRGEFVARAEAHLEGALGRRSLSECKKLLALGGPEEPIAGGEAIDIDPRLRDRVEYVRSLITVATAYLESPDAGRLLEDRSPLALAQRIRDALQSDDEGVAGVFSLIEGFARLKQGNAAEAERLLASYVEGLPADERAGASIAVADRCLRIARDSPLVFRFLRDAEVGGGADAGRAPLALAARTLQVAVAARSVESHAVEASAWIERTLARLSKVATTASDHLDVARILVSLRGIDAAADHLRGVIETFPDDTRLAVETAELLVAQGDVALRAGKKEDAAASWANALALHLRVLVTRPADGIATLRASRRLLARLDRLGPGTEPVREAVSPLFPEVAEDEVARFADTLASYLRGRFAAVLSSSQAIATASEFQPLLSFVRGTSVLEAARNGSTAVDVDAVRDAATRELERSPEHLPNRLEIAGLALQSIEEGEDVPAELMATLEKLAGEMSMRGEASLLLARAIDRRIGFLASRPRVDYDAIEKLLLRMQRSLRRVIESSPLETAAYLALARSFLVRARIEAASTGRTVTHSSADARRAINALRATPRPDLAVVAELAASLEAAGDSREARPYHLIINVSAPSRGAMGALSANLLATANEKERADLERAFRGETLELSETENGLRRQIVAALELPESIRFAALARIFTGGLAERKTVERAGLALAAESWRTIDGHEALRHMLLGELLAGKMDGVEDETARESLRQEAIAAYELALAEHERRGEQAPVLLLNNLAWHLGEGGDRSAALRGVELARRARASLPSPDAVPQLSDTLAWCLFRSGAASEARAEYDALVSRDDRPEFRYHFALVLEEIGELDEALRHLQGALDFPGFRKRAEAIKLQREIRQRKRAVLSHAGEEEA